MAFNGSGVFNRLYNWVTDAANSVPITSSRMDGEDNGFAAGLSNCITKDGQQVITADIPWNNHKITGIADAASAQDAVNLRTAQTLISSGIYAVAGGTANAITASVSSFAYSTGAAITLKIAATNTSTTVNLNVNSLGNKTVLDSVGNAISVGALFIGQVLTFVYDGTSFRMISPITSSGSFTGTLTGCSTSPTVTVYWRRTGDLVTLSLGGILSATSNSTSMSISGVPSSIQPFAVQQVFCCFLIDNGNTGLYGTAAVNGSAIQFSLAKVSGAFINGAAGSNFTASGTKGIDQYLSITYSLAIV